MLKTNCVPATSRSAVRASMTGGTPGAAASGNASTLIKWSKHGYFWSLTASGKRRYRMFCVFISSTTFPMSFSVTCSSTDDSNSYETRIFSNICRPLGFLSGWYLRASVLYALRRSAYDACLSSKPSNCRAAWTAVSTTPLVISSRHRCNVSRKNSSGSPTGQSGKRASSQKFRR